MSKQAHTPGPWAWDPKVTTPGITTKGVDEFLIWGGLADPEFVAQTASEADARLIACAPEMKEFIQWIAETLHVQEDHRDSIGNSIRTFRKCHMYACKRAVEVLPKAEGRKS